MHREHKKLLEENKKLKKTCEKYKKKLNRNNLRKTNQKNNQNYKLLTNSIKERYERIKSHKEKSLFKSLFKIDNIEKFRKKIQLLRETLGIK